VDSPGLKANLSDVQAAIGRAGLPYFAGWQARRRALAAMYRERLSSVDGITLPPEAPDGVHAWHLFVVQVEPRFGITRDEFIAALSERGVDCSVHFIPVHHHAYYRELLGRVELPVADRVFERLVSLPLYPALEDEDVAFICDQIADLHTPLLAAGVNR
jgi:perosamine synthetase